MTTQQVDALNQAVTVLQGEMQQVQGLLTQAMQSATTEGANTTARITQLADAQAKVAIDGKNLVAEMTTVLLRLTHLEQLTTASSGSGNNKEKKWEMTRPKDMEPAQFVGKDEDWLQWKEATEDYADTCHPGLKHAMGVAAKVVGPITDR